MPKGYMYILECSDGSYYTGSTKCLELRIQQHQNGEGANYTKRRLPVNLVYYEEFQRIDKAFYREKQIQGWNRKKKASKAPISVSSVSAAGTIATPIPSDTQRGAPDLALNRLSGCGRICLIFGPSA